MSVSRYAKIRRKFTACCWVCQHADGEQGEHSRHLDLSRHPGLELTQEVSEIGGVGLYQVPAQRTAPRRCQSSRRRARTITGLLSLISALGSHVVTLHVLPTVLKCIFTFGVAILCRDPRISAPIDTIGAVDQFDQRVELHHVQACQISGWFRVKP